MKHLLKISEFSQFSGLTRKTLIYYDEIGLLAPEQVLENGYRFYSYRQLETVSVIEALREIGMPLCEIKLHLDERTPEKLIDLFTLYRKKVDKKIHRLQKIQAMIDTRLSLTRKALEIDPMSISLHKCKEEALFVSDEIFYTNEDELETAIKEFYDLCETENIIYGYPFGTMISRQKLLERNWQTASRFFFKFPMRNNNNLLTNKPCGLYLIAYEAAAYRGSEKIYARMMDFIDKNGLRVSGNAYEEYLLDEIAVNDLNRFLLQISIQVDRTQI